jgi:hypothetical protein
MLQKGGCISNEGLDTGRGAYKLKKLKKDYLLERKQTTNLTTKNEYI